MSAMTSQDSWPQRAQECSTVEARALLDQEYLGDLVEMQIPGT